MALTAGALGARTSDTRPDTTALLPQKLGNYAVATSAQATAVFNAVNCGS